MKHAMRATMLLIATSLVLTGCPGLFGPKVEEITADDLTDYQGSTTFVSGEGTVTEEKATLGTVGASAGMAAGGMFMAMLTDQDFTAELGDLGWTGESLSMSISPAMFTDAVHSMIAAAAPRAFSSDGSVDEDAKTADFSFTITDETYNATDIYGPGSGYPDAAGTGTIGLFEIVADVDGSSLETNEALSQEYGTVTGKGSLETDISYNGWTMDGITIINDAQVNSAGNAKFEVTIDDGEDASVATDDIITASWDIAYVLSAGASISNTDTGEGGKFIVTFSYDERNEITVDASADDPFGAATSDVSAELVVDLYDNDGNLVKQYTWTDDELVEAGF